MMAGSKESFDLESPLVCEGIVGDGCGGGRIFYIEDSTLKAHDPQTQESMTILQNINMAKKLSKKACIVFIECKDETIEFDLSAMKTKRVKL